MPDDWEYLCAKAIGNDSALSFVYMPVVATNGRQNDYLAMWAKYQSLTIDAAMKAKLAVPGNEFHLETLPDGSLHLAQVKYAEHTVAALTGGTQTWMVNNPYVLQLPMMRIQALANIVNPQVTIGSSTITFSVTLQTGQYIEFNSMTDCKVYNQNGFYLQSITPTGAIPILVSGNNAITFNCTPPGSYTSLAEVTIASYDLQPANWDATTLGSWNFDESSGTTAVDASPYLNNGTLSANVTRVAGKSGFGAALQFNGTNTSVTIPASTSLTGLVGSFSVDLWFKYSGAGTAGKDSWTLLSKNASTSTSNDPVNIYVRASDYHLCARVGNGSTSYTLDSGVAVNDSAYHYVAVVYDNAAKTYKLYLDNRSPVVQAVPSSWLVARNTNAVKLGYWPGLSNYFNGTIDQVQILSRPLSQTEVQNRYGNQMPTVSVTLPANNATIQGPTAVSLAASVTDAVKVAFYQGSTWIADGVLQTNGTYAATWNVRAADWDAYVITAKATDSNGAITISSAVNITITGAEARWTFDAFSGVTTSDATGNTHTGTLVNGPTWTAGILNGALAFNGSNSYVSVPAPTGSPLEYTGGGMTLSAWVYVNSTETNGAFLISKPWNGGGEYNYFLQLRSDRYLTFHLEGNSSYNLVAGNGPLSTNAWHHVAVTVAGVGTATIYVDGVNAGSGQHSITNWTPSKGNAHLPFAIGTVYPYGSGWLGDPILTFNGKMDDVQIWDHALSASELLAGVVPPTVESVVVNDGSTQRSKVISVTVTFSEIVAMDAGAFEVLKKGTGGGLVNVVIASAIINGRTVATLTFGGTLAEYGSLKDGEYQLTIRGDKVRGSATQIVLDGDGNGLAGGNRLFGAQATDNFFRKFGDSDGDRDVDNLDLFRFKQSYLKPSSYRWYFDFDGDGDVDNLDFFQFRQGYLK